MESNKKCKVLVVAAHPDDEVLGCGGTIAKHTANGDDVSILIIGDGVTARYPEDELDGDVAINQVNEIKKHCVDASKVLGVNDVSVLGNHCCRFDRIPLLDIIKSIEEKINEVHPDIIYTHSPHDVNNDHGIVFKAILSATRPIHSSFCVKTVLTFEVLSSTEWNFHAQFKPNVYEDISSTMSQKVRAMGAYKSEVREFPHPRSIEAIKNLAAKRGSEVGLKCAECFELIRDIR